MVTGELGPVGVVGGEVVGDDDGAGVQGVERRSAPDLAGDLVDGRFCTHPHLRSSPRRGARRGPTSRSGRGPAHGDDRREVQAGHPHGDRGYPADGGCGGAGHQPHHTLRHLKTTRPDGLATARPTSSVSAPAAPVARASTARRSGRACPSCGFESSTLEDAAQLRADLGVRWLHPDPETPGGVVEARCVRPAGLDRRRCWCR